MRAKVSAAMLGFGGLVAFGIGLGTAPQALAENPNIYGVITPDESREISATGSSACAALGRAAAISSPLTPADAGLVLDRYLNAGWDLESASDIVRESVDRRCGQYLPAVASAIAGHGPIG